MIEIQERTKHTPEPWGPHLFGLTGTIGESMCVLLPRADYSRARACVNACAGINPEAVPDLLAAAVEWIASADAAYHKDMESNCAAMARAWAQSNRPLRAAIAKAEANP